MSIDKTYLVPLWEPTGRQMTEMEALVHTLLEHNAALQREVDVVKGHIASVEGRMLKQEKQLKAFVDGMYTDLLEVEQRVEKLEEQ